MSTSVSKEHAAFIFKVSWVLLVGGYQRFGRKYCLHHQSSSGYVTVYFGTWLKTVWRNILPPSSWYFGFSHHVLLYVGNNGLEEHTASIFTICADDESSMFVGNADIHQADYTVL
jgi:hypothetical protein